VDGQKMTSDTGDKIRFAAHRTHARQFFMEYKVLEQLAFDEVAWKHVYRTLNDKVPKLFALWACKHVMRIAGTNEFLSHQDGRCTLCPCCESEVETTSHILRCNEAGRVEAFLSTAGSLSLWLEEVNTDPMLAWCIQEYVKGRGAWTMTDLCRSLPPRYRQLGISQDIISWDRFLEGMISSEFEPIQMTHYELSGSRLNTSNWHTGLITRLLEITHGQWLYRNYMVHDAISGALATKKKEELQDEIEHQRDLGDKGLLPEDKYLTEVRLEDLSSTSGERQEYWLLAIQAARRAYSLRQQHGQHAQNRNTGDGHISTATSS
jgi:hypothetical protein